MPSLPLQPPYGIFITNRGSITEMICHLTAMYVVTINLYCLDACLTPFTFKNQQFTFLFII